VTESYEAEVPAAQNGYPVLEPVLSGKLPEGLGDDLEMLALDAPEQIAAFDSELLPILKDGMSKPVFRAKTHLQAGGADINYRGLRALVGLLIQRADQRLEKKELEQALELVEQPLKLAGAMQSRPETVSVNLFSAGYASSSIAWIQGALEAGELKPEAVDRLQKLLSQHSPGYSHLSQTITVDFAQLTNSLASEEGRGMMGIGQVEPSTLESWKQQLLDIHEQAAKLYGTAPMDAEAFNQTVLKASGPIQGLVIDYPAMATMQKRYFAEYKATELGLALVGPEGGKWKKTPADKLVAEFFAKDPASAAALDELIKVEIDQETIRIVGRLEQFELLAPGVEPVLFEHR